jgi:hypothetical protein
MIGDFLASEERMRRLAGTIELAPALGCGRHERVSAEKPPHDEDRGPYDAVRCPRWRNIDFSEATALELCCRGYLILVGAIGINHMYHFIR